MPIMRLALVSQDRQVFSGDVTEVIARPGCRHVHVAVWSSRRDESTRARPEVYFGGSLYPPEDRYDITDRAAVADMARRIKGV